MKSDELPLLEIFTRLRQAGLPLGVNEYQLVLRALQSGFGIPDQEALARLCSTLWIKSAEDKLLFDYHFAEVMAEESKQVRAQDEAVALTPAIESPKNPIIALWRTISLPTRWALGGTLVLVTGIALWSVRPTCPYFTSKPQELVEEGKKYLYEIKACLAHPTDRVEIKALQKHPWLELKDKHNGTALLSGIDTDYFDLNHYSSHLWDLQGKQLTTFYNLNINAIRFSPNGQYLVTELDDGTARLWDIQGKQLTDFGNLKIRGIVFSPNGHHLVTKSDNRTAHLWDLQGKQLADFGNLKIRDISFSLNGHHLVTELYGGTARLWDLQGKQLADFGNLKIRDIRFSPNGEHLATELDDGNVHLRSLQGEQITIFDNLKIINISFSPNGQYLVTELYGGTARLWNLQGKQLANFGNLNIRYIRFSPNGHRLVTELYGGTARLWDLQGKQLANFGNLKMINISFSTNGHHLVTRLDDRTAHLWDLQGKQLADFGNLKISDIRFSPNGHHLITKLDDGTARLWDLQGKQLANFGNLKISDIRFSPNGHRLITKLDDKTASLWDIQGKPLVEFGNLKTNESGFDFGIRVSPNGQHLIIKLDDETARLWDLQGKQLANFGNPKISDINFSPDGKILTTVSKNSEVKLQVTDKNTGKSDIQTFNLATLDSSEFQKRLVEWLIIIGFISGFLVVLLLPAGYIVARLINQRTAKPPSFPPLPQPDEGTPTNSVFNQEFKDEIQVAQAIHQGTHSTIDLPLSSFTESNEYFPITSRQMKQSWRYLRRFVREGPPIEFDLEATVQQMSSQGMLLHPVMKPRRVNRNELLLLVDRDGSMAPFHALSERLAETAMIGGRLGKAGIYYFHNCPSQHLYHDPYHQAAEPIDEILAKLHSEYTGILIFSDAGAARGAFSRERLDLTAEFLAQLQQKLRHIVWLNPLPRDRWTGSAEEIAKIVPMFELSRSGLNQAIDVLRGKSPVEMGGKL
jgi:WD40 repeat protein/uncharacterized protein with von Willebrand factor type A (vWA) domain